jgi:hypothetical protein
LSAGHESDRLHPAFRSGRSTFFDGFSILAVSAMKCTPQKTITGLDTLVASRANFRLSPVISASSWISPSW